jgi:hypothetical protein
MSENEMPVLVKILLMGILGFIITISILLIIEGPGEHSRQQGDCIRAGFTQQQCDYLQRH